MCQCLFSDPNQLGVLKVDVLAHIIISLVLNFEFVLDLLVLMMTQEQYGHVSTMAQQDPVDEISMRNEQKGMMVTT